MIHQYTPREALIDALSDSLAVFDPDLLDTDVLASVTAALSVAAVQCRNRLAGDVHGTTVPVDDATVTGDNVIRFRPRRR